MVKKETKKDLKSECRLAVSQAVKGLILDNNEAFYGHLASQVQRKIVDNSETNSLYFVPTAAVMLVKNDFLMSVNANFFVGKCECENPEWITHNPQTGAVLNNKHCKVCSTSEKPLTKAERISIIKHEIQHLAHRHLTRFERSNYNPRTMMVANIAMDAVINQYNKEIPEGSVDYQNIEGADPHKTWDNYYKLLMKDVEKNQSQNGEGQSGEGQSGEGQGSGGQCQACDNAENGDSQGGGSGDESGDDSQDGKQCGGNGSGDEKGDSECTCGGLDKYGRQFDDHKHFGKIDEETNVDIADNKLKREIRRAARKTTQGCGNVSVEVQQILDEIKAESKINWQQALRNWIVDSIRRERTMSPFRESLAVDDLYPGRSFKKLPEFDIYADASGSVNDEEFAQFCAEVIAISKALKATVNLHQFDTQVHASDKITSKAPALVRKATGGTSFTCIVEHARQNKIRNIIVMTDGGCPEVNWKGFNVLAAYTPSHVEHKSIRRSLVIED
jgi:predicted metal-dependent peptidase